MYIADVGNKGSNLLPHANLKLMWGIKGQFFILDIVSRFDPSLITLNAKCPSCGTSFSKHLHVIADFLIGAHALTHVDCIISRDLGVYKTYFKDLKVIN